MVQAKERKPNQSPSQGQDSTSQATGGHKPPVPVEIGGTRDQVKQSLHAQFLAFEALKQDYVTEAQALSDYMTRELYSMVSGRTLFNQVASNLGKLMSQHPTMPKPELAEMQFSTLSLKPYEPGTQQQRLTGSSEGESEK
jgi:hypothetical protein